MLPDKPGPAGPGVEERRAEQVAQPELPGRVMAGALDAAEQPVYPVPPCEQFRHASPRANTPVSRAISARSRASASSRAGSVMIR